MTRGKGAGIIMNIAKHKKTRIRLATILISFLLLVPAGYNAAWALSAVI